MRLQAASVRRWPLGTLFIFLATALVAVFGITAANAAARQVTGTAPSEAFPPVDTLAKLPTVTTASVAAPEKGDDVAPAPVAATAPEPVRPVGVLLQRPGPAAPTDRAAPGFTQPERGRAPPA